MQTKSSSSPDETIAIAKEFAKSVKPGDVICLQGELGSGKTHFVRGFVQGFGILGDVVTSPTFTIINEYDGDTPIYHFDFYRLEDYREAIEIGAEEYLHGNGVCIVEWPDRIAEILPTYSRMISLNVTDKEKREIIFH
jgi:tRNA threonylcarbamoyladenosine biosynthesis protein TsaE